jgi:2-phosphosulfolactate phosphatase
MEIATTDFVAGAQAARGTAIVIDVFRAFSVAAHAFARGAAGIIPMADIAAARKLKTLHPDFLLVGERFGKRLPGFDCGNSPTELERFDLAGRTLIHTTHSGTQGLANALQADEVLTGALVNAAAIVRYLHASRPARVTLVRMGQHASHRCDEDDLCAELLASRIGGLPFDDAGVVKRLRQAPSAQKFFDPACDWAPAGDFAACTDLDRFDFVLRLDRSAATPCLRRIDT